MKFRAKQKQFFLKKFSIYIQSTVFKKIIIELEKVQYNFQSLKEKNIEHKEIFRAQKEKNFQSTEHKKINLELRA